MSMDNQTPLNSTSHDEKVFAQRLLLLLEQQDVDHNTAERLRVIRLAAIERAVQKASVLAPLTQSNAQTAHAGVISTGHQGGTLSGLWAGLNPFGSNKNPHKSRPFSLLLLASVAALLAYWLTTGMYKQADTSPPASLGLMSQSPALTQPFYEAESINAALATHLMRDPVPPSAYADEAFLEYMERQLAAQHD